MSSTANKTAQLFAATKVGHMHLQHRIVLEPMSRFRASAEHVPSALAVEYYAQRASAPGTLLITEGTVIAPQAGGLPNVPGIWSAPQIAAWKKVVDAVHDKGGFIFLQLWALGRPALEPVLKKAGAYDVASASATKLDDEHVTARALSVDEIQEYVQLYAQAARNGVHGAGFDGVELHAANGYLPDQFLQTGTNTRTDAYGGSVANRIRFVAEVVDALAGAVGPARTGVRISPWSTFMGMGMRDPVPTFSALVRHLADQHPALAYLHAVEPRADGPKDVDYGTSKTNDFLREAWGARPLILAGGYTRELAIEAAARDDDLLVGVGRPFTSNPDLVRRWRDGLPLTPYDRASFRTPGPKGYTDWPFHG